LYHYTLTYKIDVKSNMAILAHVLIKSRAESESVI